jgi:trehalose 6-phosphate phosphatase
MTILPPPPPNLLEGAALFLDFDGTLVDLAETPDSIRVAPGLVPLLVRLRGRLRGRLAIISGRSLADLDKHLDCPGLLASGSHGVELRLGDGQALLVSVPERMPDIRAEVARFAEGKAGFLIEEKPAGVALHYRLAPEEGDSALAFMTGLGDAHGLAVQRGNMVVELRPKGADKGEALRAFMAEPDFADARPVFVGDDLTDEHGFEAAAALGGSGILVGAARDTAARYRLADVAAVSDWLSQAR